MFLIICPYVQKTTIETKGFTVNTIDFVLRNKGQKDKMSLPLTVAVKTETGASVALASSADGHALKAWPCATDKLCIDVDSFDQNIHVQWK